MLITSLFLISSSTYSKYPCISRCLILHFQWDYNIYCSSLHRFWCWWIATIFCPSQMISQLSLLDYWRFLLLHRLDILLYISLGFSHIVLPPPFWISCYIGFHIHQGTWKVHRSVAMALFIYNLEINYLKLCNFIKLI